MAYRNDSVASRVWRLRYRAPELGESEVASTYARVANDLASVEGVRAPFWSEEFLRLMCENRFLPGGRILSGAGRSRTATLANCFVMGVLEDTLDGIFTSLKECALTLQANGGIGVDFSTLRPRGATAGPTGQTASGPVSFLNIWNQMSETLLSTNPRQGAMMGVLDCSHPDILDFIHAKREVGQLRHFTLSVLLSDAFMSALGRGEEWPLVHAGEIWQTIPAQQVWDAIMEGNQEGGEPGVIFIDRVNGLNRLSYTEDIRATNPCGELPLPPYGACLIGSLVLPSFVQSPFKPHAQLNQMALESSVRTAVRLMDNAVSRARFPLEQQQTKALATRRIGIGITGLADALAMLGLSYDSPAGRAQAAGAMAVIRDTAYLTSAELADEKGCFPALDTNAYLGNPHAPPLPEDVINAIRTRGLRNSHLTAIAPAGSISLLAGNVSSGIEPIFDWRYNRHLGGDDGELDVMDYAVARWQEQAEGKPLPSFFQRDHDIDPEDQVAMIAALQPFVDSGISKTVTVAPGAPDDIYERIFHSAYREGLKGITAFPESARRGAVLERTTACAALALSRRS